jgi:uncharacterized membrane protein YeaQ/YmgE (transglycosylase-associated protein family)
VSLVWTMLIGLAASLIAKLLMPAPGAGGFALRAALGVGGSLAATFLGRFAGLFAAHHSAGFIGAVVGATVCLIGHQLIATK